MCPEGGPAKQKAKSELGGRVKREKKNVNLNALLTGKNSTREKEGLKCIVQRAEAK